MTKIYRLYVDGSYIDYYFKEKHVKAQAKTYEEQGKTILIIEEDI